MKQTYGSKIMDLILYAEKLESVQYLYDYFIHLKNNRNCFVVEMRRLIANDLKQQGFNVVDIALILSKHHSSIIYINDTLASNNVALEVKENYKDWIEQGVYPKSVREKQVSHFHKDGIKTVIVYELIKK
jgi:hypothetical protein